MVSNSLTTFLGIRLNRPGNSAKKSIVYIPIKLLGPATGVSVGSGLRLTALIVETFLGDILLRPSASSATRPKKRSVSGTRSRQQTISLSDQTNGKSQGPNCGIDHRHTLETRQC